MLITNILIFLVSCAFLILAGSGMVRCLAKIARYFRLSYFLAAFVIVGLSTSVPELFVGISAALAGNSALALGTVIGSNIANLTLVMGIGVLIAKGIRVRSKIIRKDAYHMFLLSLAPLILMMIGNQLSRIDGIILIAIFIVYLWRIQSVRGKFSRKLADGISKGDIAKAVVIFVVSVIVLFISANFVVEYASLIAIEMALPPIIIGLFIIAIGTSLPELAFQAKAALSENPEMTIGNVIGSNIANATLILGVTAIIFPIQADFLLFLTSGVFMIVVSFLFVSFLESGSKLYWKEGLSMILLYVFFIIIEFYISNLEGKELF